MVGLSSVRWKRVLLAVCATHVLNLAVSVLAIIVYVLASSTLLSGAPDLAGQIAGGMAVWGVPVVTFFAAVWATLRVESQTAALHGLLVGLLVAAVFGLLFFWPLDMASLALFVLMITAGLVGGVIGVRVEGYR